MARSAFAGGKIDREKLSCPDFKCASRTACQPRPRLGLCSLLAEFVELEAGPEIAAAAVGDDFLHRQSVHRIIAIGSDGRTGRVDLLGLRSVSLVTADSIYQSPIGRTKIL